MGRKIFEAVTFHNLSMKNRLIRSATWEGIANFDGSITDEAYEIYRELAHGGVGAVIKEQNRQVLTEYRFTRHISFSLAASSAQEPITELTVTAEIL